MYAQDSIELLKQSGIDFAQNETRGIDVRHFGELLTVSGVVLNEDVSMPCCTPLSGNAQPCSIGLWDAARHAVVQQQAIPGMQACAFGHLLQMLHLWL